MPLLPLKLRILGVIGGTKTQNAGARGLTDSRVWKRLTPAVFPVSAKGSTCSSATVYGRITVVIHGTAHSATQGQTGAMPTVGHARAWSPRRNRQVMALEMDEDRYLANTKRNRK